MGITPTFTPPSPLNSGIFDKGDEIALFSGEPKLTYYNYLRSPIPQASYLSRVLSGLKGSAPSPQVSVLY